MSSEIKRLYADEKNAILDLYTAITATEKARRLEGRLELIDGGKRKGMLKSAKGMLLSILEDIFSTIPTEQLLSIQKNLPGLRYSCGIKNAAGTRQNEYGRWLSYDAIDAITTATQDYCMMCNKSIGEQYKCPLAKALDELPITENKNASGCRYSQL